MVDGRSIKDSFPKKYTNLVCAGLEDGFGVSQPCGLVGIVAQKAQELQGGREVGVERGGLNKQGAQAR
jgi:hypothetical protein